MTHPIDVGQLVLLHDPNDRPPSDPGSNGRGYHWSIWQRTAVRGDEGYHIIVDWAGRHAPEALTIGSLVADLDDKFIVVETNQPILDAYVMAAIHMKPGQWHAMLDRKYSWDEIDQLPREFHR